MAEITFLALTAFFFLLLHSAMQYDTLFTSSLMNQGLAKSSVEEIMATIVGEG